MAANPKHDPQAATTDTPPPADPPSPFQDYQEYLEPGLEPGELGRLGRYPVEKFLGCGQRGIVFRAVDTTRGCAVAIKVLRHRLQEPEKALERFRLETMTRIDHPHVVKILDHGEICV